MLFRVMQQRRLGVTLPNSLMTYCQPGGGRLSVSTGGSESGKPSLKAAAPSPTPPSASASGHVSASTTSMRRPAISSTKPSCHVFW